tara:strand:+ start:3548 stop:4753 length:1206 start_codon:yes stop_codon:yes gene_type:complete
MAKKKKEETTEQVVEQPKVDDKVEKIQIKKKPTPKKFAQDDEPIKVDLSKPPKPEENETKENSDDKAGVVEDVKSEDSGTTQEQEEIQPKEETQETPVLEEVTDEESIEVKQEEIEEAIVEAEASGKPLPESIQKLVDFMEETGGDLNDYVKLNQDYSNLENTDLLREYYKQTKPHLNAEEIDFLMEDQFSYDEEMDGEVDIKRKKLALKEQVAEAKQHLDGAKSKYYEDIKAGSKLTTDQQKAIDFFNRYNKESEEQQKATKHSQSVFTQKTNEVFNDGFKGFEYNVGDKRFRFNVSDVENVKQTQSDITNFTRKFLDKNSTLKDAKGYHKSMFTAMNPDAVANHFYEQGKADALKDSIAKSKNIDMNPRQSHGTVEAGGIKVKVLGDNSNDFKFKIKQK